MGLFDRFGTRAKGESKRARAARARELEGDLAGAAQLYQEADLPDEVARVLLLRADAEKGAEKRLAFLAAAVRVAASEELRRSARGRKALVAFDVLRGREGPPLRSETLAVARELEAAGELERAADAYALAEDAEAEVRVLTAAGAIERLEERLGRGEAADRSRRALDECLQRIDDLDRTAERKAALALAAASLARHADERLEDTVRAIRARVARGPVVDLELDGALARYALGAEVTFGRGDATIVLASPAVSRRHVRLFLCSGVAFVEDLGTRNGTTLAGARLTVPIPVGAGVRLELGGAVPLVVEPHGGGGLTRGFRVEAAGDGYLVPLGPVAVGAWRVDWEAGAESYVVLLSAEGERPLLRELALGPRVELAVGDELRQGRGGPVRLRLPGHGATGVPAEETPAGGTYA